MKDFISEGTQNRAVDRSYQPSTQVQEYVALQNVDSRWSKLGCYRSTRDRNLRSINTKSYALKCDLEMLCRLGEQKNNNAGSVKLNAAKYTPESALVYLSNLKDDEGRRKYKSNSNNGPLPEKAAVRSWFSGRANGRIKPINLNAGHYHGKSAKDLQQECMSRNLPDKNTRNSRNINLGNFQSIEIVRLHCDNGITFHVAAVLVDCARSAKQKNFDIGAPMIIEYSQVISMAVNISRCFVLRDMNLLEVRKSIDSCSSTQEDKNVLLELLDQIIKLLPCCNVNDLTTQHWLGNNVIFGHIKKEGASKNMYQRATCKYKDGYEFTAVFDIVLQMLSVGLFTNNAQLWNSMYDRMFSNSEKMTDQMFEDDKLTNRQMVPPLTHPNQKYRLLQNMYLIISCSNFRQLGPNTYFLQSSCNYPITR